MAGKRLTAQSAKLIEEVYDKKWFEQTPNFQKSIAVIQTVVANPINVTYFDYKIFDQNIFQVLFDYAF